MSTRLAATTVSLLAAASVAAPAVAGPGRVAPRPALVTAHALTIRSTVGTYCVQGRARHGTQVGMCADYAYPLRTRGRLPVDGGNRVALRFRHNPRIEDRPKSVRISPLRVSAQQIDSVSSTIAAVQSRQHPRRWSATLPADLDGANVLDVAVRYRQGDADFWAGIQPTN